METDKLIGWHFVSQDRRLRDGRIAEAGKTYRVEGEISLRKRGLHASRRAVNALAYAPGPVVCRVILREDLYISWDKAVARERTILWMEDASRALVEYAHWCVELVTEEERRAGIPPDPGLKEYLERARGWFSVGWPSLSEKNNAYQLVDAAIDRVVAWGPRVARAALDTLSRPIEASYVVYMAMQAIRRTWSGEKSLYHVLNDELERRLFQLNSSILTEEENEDHHLDYGG